MAMKTNLTIKDLENLSGVKTHTIRVWEKRYNLIEPQRTATNIRFYENKDLKKLLNVSSLISSGMKISTAAKLSTEKLNSAVENLYKNSKDTFETLVVNDLVIATLNFDFFLFDKSYTGYCKINGFEASIEKILYPLLVRIGLLWTVDKINIAQEHFLSQLIRQKLFTAINEVSIKASASKFLLYLPENQHHEIGLLYAYYLIKKKGIQCVYLGPNVPLSYAKYCAETIKATHVICSFTIPISKGKMAAYMETMSEYFKDYKVIIHSSMLDKLDTQKHQSLSFLSTIDDLKKMLN